MPKETLECEEVMIFDPQLEIEYSSWHNIWIFAKELLLHSEMVLECLPVLNLSNIFVQAYTVHWHENIAEDDGNNLVEPVEDQASW